MQLHRLRLQLSDAPGRLGEAAAALGALGVNIAGLDVQTHDGERRIDELLVDFTVPLDLAAVEHALRAVGCDVEDLRPADPHELTDGITRSLELAGLVQATGPRGPHLAEVARQLVRAERAWLGPVGTLPLHGVAARAASTGSPAQASEPSKLLPAGGRSTWCLAVPFGPQVVVLVRRGHRFSFTETARVQALLRLVPSGTTTHELADGGAVVVRRLAGDDRAALVRQHVRCSDETRYRRYFSPMPTLPTQVLDRLVEDGFVALCGTEVVGTVHLCRSGRDVDSAFLVEDAHQRRGIGTVLLRTAIASAVAEGASALTAETLAANVALPRLLARAGGTRRYSFEDGTIRFRIELDPALLCERPSW